MTTFGLKFLALILMALDHIGLFFSDAPIWLRWLGRISAPLFIFSMIYGFSYTKNRKIYLIRMYLFGVGMAIMDFILNCITEGDLVSNNIFVTLFSIAIIIRLIDYKRENHPKWKVYITCFCFWQIVSSIILLFIVTYYNFNFFYLSIGLMGNIFFNEGGFVFVALGVMLYYVKANKKNIAVFYSLFCILYSLITISDFIPRIMGRLNYYQFDVRFATIYNALEIIFPLLGFATIGIHYDSILYVDFQWMMIGALPFMLLFNGKKGKKIKYFFYIFYPVHILLLFIISYVT